MGVLGLVPFLQKTCPEVFKSLPQRLKSLSGKTVVIDGTLITQRLHFAPMPHPYRHVLGWYRIAKELKDANVEAICIFDGKSRTFAKQGEIERRRETRRIVTFRGELEAERLRRLCNLTSHVKAWRNLNAQAQESASRELKELVHETSLPTTSPSYVAGNLELPVNVISQAPSTSTSPKEAYGHFHEGDLCEVLGEYSSTLVRTGPEPGTEPPEESTGPIGATAPKVKSLPAATSDAARTLLERLSLEDTDPTRVDEVYEAVDELPLETVSVIGPSEPLSADGIKSALASSYLEYRASLVQLSHVSEVPPMDQVPATSDDATEARADYVMSKIQHQLVLDEGKFWEQLADSTPPESVEATVVALAEKSSVVCDSYERRTHPPTTETYEESTEILRAMGVPCIECDGPFEAEALASSMVLHGFADYVASEDTDVIVYGAPLLRNLTRREEPLVVVSGEEVRTMLKLDQKRFIDFALLLGTDFSQRIKNIGPQRALKFIREYGCIEKVLEHETQFPPRIAPALYLDQVDEARVTFETLPPTPDVTLLQSLQYDENLVHKVLRRYGLEREIFISDWDYSDALAGNYFQDNPAAS